jgi:predicted RNase H-like nuclease (RuvC/YqgF family)
VKLEAEFSELKSYFSTPEKYGDAAQITAATRRHRELEKTIPRLTEEWAELSFEAERKQQEFESAKEELLRDRR